MDYQNEFKSKDGSLKLVIDPDLRQHHIEALEAEISRLPHLTGVGHSSSRGAALRAAIASEWIKEPKAEKLMESKTKKPRYLLEGRDVAEMMPNVVAWYGKMIDDVYSELTDISPFF